jgi:hypothetical protein
MVLAHAWRMRSSRILGSQGFCAGAVAWRPGRSLVFPAPMGDFRLVPGHFADRHGFGSRILDRRIGMPLFDTGISRVARRSR